MLYEGYGAALATKKKGRYLYLFLLMDVYALNFQLLGSVYIFFSLTLSASGYDSFVYIYVCFNIHRYIYIYVIYNLLDYYKIPR